MNGKDKGNYSLRIVGDADALVALIHQEDPHHAKAKKVSQALIARNTLVIFPATAISESITVLQRKFARPNEVEQLLKNIADEALFVRHVDAATLRNAVEIFRPRGSKKNTLFDAIVATVAKEENADVIFSFDDWYRKQGFTLAEDLD